MMKLLDPSPKEKTNIFQRAQDAWWTMNPQTDRQRFFFHGSDWQADKENQRNETQANHKLTRKTNETKHKLTRQDKTKPKVPMLTTLIHDHHRLLLLLLLVFFGRRVEEERKKNGDGESKNEGEGRGGWEEGKIENVEKQLEGRTKHFCKSMSSMFILLFLREES